MAIEKTIEWCLLWTELCLPSSEWAAWAQAVFSALAVLAAIGVVWWQIWLTKRHNTRAARLIASGLLTMMNQIIGGIEIVEGGLKARTSGNNSSANSPRNLVTILKTLPLPSKEELIALNIDLHECAISLIRASNSTRQICEALEVLSETTALNDEQGNPPAALFELPYQLASNAKAAFAKAREALDMYCPQ
jgi:cell division protein FtsL